MHLPKIEALPKLLVYPERFGRLVLAELFTPTEADMATAAINYYPSETPETGDA